MAHALWPGTIGPTVGTPRRRPGSLRRTSTIDITWPDGYLEGLVLTGRARDLRTHEDGQIEVRAAASMEARVAFPGDRRLQELALEPDPHGAAAVLVGSKANSRMRHHMDEVTPGAATDGSLPALLLDEISVATLISGSALARIAGPDVFRSGAAQSTKLLPVLDVCAGWVDGGTMVQSLLEGETIYGEGPPAPPVEPEIDPWAWHHHEDLPRHSMRRRRRLDLWRSEDGWSIDVFFRDSYVEDDGTETVVHEYLLDLTAAPEGTIRRVDARAGVLPGPDCPNALASAHRLVGMPLADVRAHVRQEFSGTSTCTHLNDALRSVGDLATLLPAL